MWAWGGDRELQQKERQETGKSSRDRKNTGGSPESPLSLPSKAAQGEAASEDPLAQPSLECSWHFCRYYSCGRYPWRDSEELKTTLNKLSIIISLIAIVRIDAESRKVVSCSSRLGAKLSL